MSIEGRPLVVGRWAARTAQMVPIVWVQLAPSIHIHGFTTSFLGCWCLRGSRHVCFEDVWGTRTFAQQSLGVAARSWGNVWQNSWSGLLWSKVNATQLDKVDPGEWPRADSWWSECLKMLIVFQPTLTWMVKELVESWTPAVATHDRYGLENFYCRKLADNDLRPEKLRYFLDLLSSEHVQHLKASYILISTDYIIIATILYHMLYCTIVWINSHAQEYINKTRNCQLVLCADADSSMYYWISCMCFQIKNMR